MRPGPFRLLLLLFPLFVCRQLFVVAVQEAASEHTPPPPPPPTASHLVGTTTKALTASTATPVVTSSNFNNSNLIYNNSNLEETNTFPTTPAVVPVKKNLTVGYLTAIKGDLKDKQGLAISGALGYALQQVNNDSTLLPNVNLVLKWYDTRGDTVLTTRAITEMLCEGVTAFFGPEGSCYVEAIVAQSRNIPMISYKCSDYKASKVPTFARTEPPDTQVTKSVISLLNYFKWYKFSIIAEKEWESVARSLQEQANQYNFTVNHYKVLNDRHECCIKKMVDCCQNGFWYQLVHETKNGTRIYVFMGTSFSLQEMMHTMQTLGIFDNGEYMVIYVDPETYSYKESHKYLWRNEMDKVNNCMDQRNFLNRARSLLVIVLSPPNESYQNLFSNTVRKYNHEEPFHFPTPPIFSNISFEKYVSIYASYLYDSVKLYANALDKLLKEQPFLNDTIIEQVASNGTKIIETIIKNKTYISITGATIKLDSNGDSEGNYTVLALKPANFTFNNFSCSYYMIPIGQFQEGDQLPNYKMIAKLFGVDWAGGQKPEDEPSCGFLNQLCAKEDKEQGKIIVAGVLGLLLFCTSVITLSIYRKWKIEQEIEGLLWKIDPNDLCLTDNMVASPSKVSLVSAASYESRCGAQVFAMTGVYRGVTVRIKELKFSKKKDIARNVMKEMRLLREFRHDNINTFIGATVEPIRVLIVTDYCAKGSLYDIVENEDIKLDKMFIASLVHDLIKGMIFLHSSLLVCHGNLKSSNCVVTSRWVLQITDFGLHDLRHCAENDSIGEHQYYRSLLWKAPELLRDPHAPICGTQKADIYAFAIIMHEIIGRRGPFGACGIDEPKEIVNAVKKVPEIGEPLFRPNLDILRYCEAGQDFVLSVIEECWAECPEMRPDFPTIRSRLKHMKDGKRRNIMDQMMEMMEKYANNLEELVNQRTLEVFDEKKKTEDLLHRMLPAPVAQRLTEGIGIEPESFDLVTIYFSDIVGFTSLSAESTPFEVVNFLNDLYTLFDSIIKGYDVYKVETIGDAYMVVSGLPLKNGDNHAGEIASMSLDLLSAVKNHRIAHRPNDTLQLRIGIHTGPVVAGVVGLTMPRYCLFGDTVNTASRMESNGLPLKIHISVNCHDALEKIGGYMMEKRGSVFMKGKGEMVTYWLIGAKEGAIQRRDVDITDLPPLFCRPRRSPKLVSGGGDGSRRQSAAPRGNSIDRGVPDPSPFPNRRLIQEAKSLDPFLNRHYDKKSPCKLSCHSLQENSRDGVVGNGSLVNAPLLNEYKRCKSLEIVNALRHDEIYPKKLNMRSSIRSWLFGFFNPTHRNSDISLRKVNYTDLPSERGGVV